MLKRISGESPLVVRTNVGNTTITFDRPHGFGGIVKVASITGGSGLTNGVYHNVKVV